MGWNVCWFTPFGDRMMWSGEKMKILQVRYHAVVVIWHSIIISYLKSFTIGRKRSGNSSGKLLSISCRYTLQRNWGLTLLYAALNNIPHHQWIYEGMVGDGKFKISTLSFKLVHYEGSPWSSAQTDGLKYDHVVVPVCRFAKTKRIPSLLSTASGYEKDLSGKIVTLIVGTGLIQKQLQDLAYDKLKLEHTYFLGPQQQPALAKLYKIASIGAFPFHNEAFGMECMACGTMGGPIDLLTTVLHPYTWNKRLKGS